MPSGSLSSSTMGDNRFGPDGFLAFNRPVFTLTFTGNRCEFVFVRSTFTDSTIANNIFGVLLDFTGAGAVQPAFCTITGNRFPAGPFGLLADVPHMDSGSTITSNVGPTAGWLAGPAPWTAAETLGPLPGLNRP